MRTKLLKLGEPIFQVWGGEKKGEGGPKFFQNPRGRGTNALHTMPMLHHIMSVATLKLH